MLLDGGEAADGGHDRNTGRHIERAPGLDARHRIHRGKWREVEAERHHAILRFLPNAIGVEQVGANGRRDGDDRITDPCQPALESDEHRGHELAEVAVEHVAVVGVNHARTRRASARQVVRRRRQPAQQTRLRHVGMNDGRLPGAELSIQPPQRAQIVERRQRAAQRRQEHRVGAGRQQVAHVAFAVTETAVEESRAVAVRVECGGESGRLDRRSADVEARDHARNAAWCSTGQIAIHQFRCHHSTIRGAEPRSRRLAVLR